MHTVFESHAPDPRVVDRALASSALSPFWIDDLTDTRTYPSLGGQCRRVDLAVIGGGYTGLWSALRAVQRNPGITVALLEAHEVGWAASGRNGGFVEATLTHGEENGRRRWPHDMERLQSLGNDNLNDIETTITALGLDCDFERTGSLSVAVEPYQVAELTGACHSSGDRVLDQVAVRDEVNSPTYLAGLWSPDSTALVHPAKLAKELARAATECGVDIFEHTKALHLGRSRPHGGITVQTERSDITADRIILATNAFPSLLRRYRYQTVPVYDYVLVTEPLTTEQLSAIGWRHRQGVSDLANQFHYYRLTPDNRILWGGYDAIYHFGGAIRSRYEQRESTYRRLAAHFFTTFPDLEGLRFTHRWGGVIDASTRFCAFFGSARRGRIAYAAGFTGLGVAASRFAADVMLDRLHNAHTERSDLDMVNSTPLPFPPEPLAAVAINATRWSLDRADHRHGKRNLFLKTLDSLGLGFDS